MADVGLRDLGSVVPGVRARDDQDAVVPLPSAAAPPAVIVMPAPPATTPKAVFGADHPSGTDALGIGALVAHLAELVVHKGTVTPLCIGLLGPPGAGKSFASGKLAARMRDLAADAAHREGPYLSALHVETIDAADLEGDPLTALAGRIHAGLRQPYPDLARELGHAARDPHVVLREVNETLDEARRRLDTERRALDDAGSRRARLTETVLYEAAGSQVDAYARANRAGIENRFVAFGVTGDPIRNYKDLVQFVAGSGGKRGLALRSLWAFRGQTKLIVAAVALVALGIGFGIAFDQQATWLGDLRGGPQAGANAANWAQAHVHLLKPAQRGAYLLAALAIVVNLWRAYGFLQPILKGARLLEGDLDARRRDLDGLYAHQTKRVDALDADVERLTRESAEAERRAGGSGPASDAPSPFEGTGRHANARNFFAVLTAMMGDPKARAVPRRLVVAIDHLDAVAPDRAAALLGGIHRVAGAGLVSVVAADPARLVGAANGVTRQDLERWVQVPVRIGSGVAAGDYANLVQTALGHASSPATMPKVDARQSALDAPFDDGEVALLTALAPIAGGSPRAVKRFVNLYTLARLDGDHRGALALMLALAQGGTDAEHASVNGALAAEGHASPFAVPQAGPRLRAALDAASAEGRPTQADAAKAAGRVAIFSV